MAHRCIQLDCTVFVTVRTAGDWLRDARGKDAVLDALRMTRQHHPFHHCAHAVLDDHLHLLLATMRGASIAACFAACTHATRISLGLHRDTPLWSPGYRHRLVRDAVAFRACLDHCHRDPVKHGLAAAAAEYRWSSFATWFERGIYPDDWA